MHINENCREDNYLLESLIKDMKYTYYLKYKYLI